MTRQLHDTALVTELLCDAAEPEPGTERVYGQPVLAAVDHELKEEWSRYLGTAGNQGNVLMGVFHEGLWAN